MYALTSPCRQVELKPLIDVKLLQDGVVAGIYRYFLLFANIVNNVGPLFLCALGLSKFNAKDLLHCPEYLHVRIRLVS